MQPELGGRALYFHECRHPERSLLVHPEASKRVNGRELTQLFWPAGARPEAPRCPACGESYEWVGGDQLPAELEEVREDAEGSPPVPAQ